MKNFEDFFKENQNTIYKIVKYYVKYSEDAKDIVSECMFIIYNKWEKISKMDNIVGYAIKVAINLSKKMLLRKKIRNFIYHNDYEDDLEIKSNSNPEKSYIVNEENKFIENELNKLKEIERNIIILKDIDNKKFEEVAEIFNKKLPTVKSIYRRAKLKILKNNKKEDLNEIRDM